MVRTRGVTNIAAWVPDAETVSGNAILLPYTRGLSPENRVPQTALSKKKA